MDSEEFERLSYIHGELCGLIIALIDMEFEDKDSEKSFIDEYLKRVDELERTNFINKLTARSFTSMLLGTITLGLQNKIGEAVDSGLDLDVEEMYEKLINKDDNYSSIENRLKKFEEK